MKARIIPGKALTPDLQAAWAAILAGDAALGDPFLRPEFVAAVAAVRSDVEIAVIEEHDRISGFFPFQRTGWNIAKPVAGRLSNCQAVIMSPGAAWDPRELLARCRLRAWDFEQLLAGQEAVQPYHRIGRLCRYLDVSQGFDAYLMLQKAKSRKQLPTVLRRGEKLRRECADVHFEAHVPDAGLLQRLIAWKSAQARAAGGFDPLGFDWSRRLLEGLLVRGDEAFSSLLSVLWADGQPAAIAYSLRSRRTLHGWFFGFSKEFAKYSPGLVSILELARTMPTLGIDRCYMGTGGDAYQTAFSSGYSPMAEGSVTQSPLLAEMRDGWRRTRQWLKSGPLRPATTVVARVTRPLRAWLTLH